MKVERNPPGIEGAYLAGLNACFGDWGGSDMFRWSFQRAFDGQLPDLLSLREEGRIVAGSAVSYRKAEAGHGPLRVAILGGSWTLPAARKRGAFTCLIQEARALAAQRGAALLLAFVTATNPSSRRLLAAGAAHWNTHYLSAGPAETAAHFAAAIQPVAAARDDVRQIVEGYAVRRGGDAHFVYDMDDWNGQFLARPAETELLAINTGILAVVEKHAQADRILSIACTGDHDFGVAVRALRARASAHGRGLMLFTTSDTRSELSMAAGLQRVPGYLMGLPANEGLLRQSAFDAGWQDIEWDLQSGDRM